jgi:hypothetical protein
MRLRVPSPADFYALPALGPLLLLDLAAAIASNALRAQHVQIEGDFSPNETDDVTTARVLAHDCDRLRVSLNDFRRRALARLAQQRADWPF